MEAEQAWQLQEVSEAAIAEIQKTAVGAEAEEKILHLLQIET